jgi:hypothetical protein
MNEAALQNHIRHAIATSGGHVWRNNVGACEDKDGRMIRYGLCNDSKQLNDRIKSSDLIGITSVVIQPHHVGKRLGVFTAVECKAEGWRLTPGDKRGQAQLRYINIVREAGGFAGFAASLTDLQGIIG